MCEKLFLPLKPELILDYTYKLIRGKLPEKIYLQKNRYVIIDFNKYKTTYFYKQLDEMYFSGIYDTINKSFLKIQTRSNNNKIIQKCITLYKNDNTVIKQTYYIPLCVKLLGDPDNIKSISIDHIDINNMNDTISNLRWATCSEQNSNKTRKETFDEYDDWIYVFENIHYDSIETLYKYLIKNNLIKNIPPKRFRDQLQKSCKKNKLTYGLNITRLILEMKDKGKEEWRPLDTTLKLKQFEFISNYGRLGRKYDDIIIPRTVNNNITGYKHIKLKYLKSSIAIHNLVYTHFKGHIPNGYIVDHIDEDKNNNHISNLNLLTTSENISKTLNTNKEHKATVNIELINILTNEKMCFNTKKSCANYFNLSITSMNYKLKTSINNTIKINNNEYEFIIKNKKEYYNKYISSPKFNMLDISKNITKSFYSEKEVYSYYKSNGYKFSPQKFKSILNSNCEYNMPNFTWVTV
jgi:hypothetical protein